jgi:hypothetical protein
MANPFVHVELQTQDPAKARGFYKGLFDWELQDTPGMDYTMINVGQGTWRRVPEGEQCFACCASWSL